MGAAAFHKMEEAVGVSLVFPFSIQNLIKNLLVHVQQVFFFFFFLLPSARL